MVYTERAEMAAVSCGTSHARAVSTPLRWIHAIKSDKKLAIKTREKKLVTHVDSHASAVSLFENGEQRYIKAINNNIGPVTWKPLRDAPSLPSFKSNLKTFLFKKHLY